MLTQRSIRSIVIALALLIIALSSVVSAADRKVIGIVDFDTNTTVDPALAPIITSLLAEDIVTNRSFQLLSRSSLQLKLSGAGLSTNVFESCSQLQPEQFHGVHFLVIGKIVEASTQVVPLNGFQQRRARVALTARVMHVPAAQVVYAESSIGEAQQTFLLEKKETEAEALANRKALLETAAKRAIARVSAKLHLLNPMTGIVIQVNTTDNTMIIDLGAEQGVSVGQDYMVYEEGAVLVHPVTNMEIGRENKEIAKVRIVGADTLRAKAVIVKGHISDITPGSRVKKSNLTK